MFFETPTNPALEIFTILQLSEMAHAGSAQAAVDNTFASPINQRPLALGADFIVHSATKYLGGHSDITVGVLLGAQSLLAPARDWRKNLEPTIAPETAFLLAKSLRTLALRVERQNATAATIAHAMQSHPRVARVLYPSLPAFPGYATAAQQTIGFGEMLAIEISGTRKDASQIMDKLKLFAIAPSLGGVEGLATQPITTGPLWVIH